MNGCGFGERRFMRRRVRIRVQHASARDAIQVSLHHYRDQRVIIASADGIRCGRFFPQGVLLYTFGWFSFGRLLWCTHMLVFAQVYK